METVLLTCRKVTTLMPPDIEAAKNRGMLVANDIVTIEKCFTDDPKYTYSGGVWGFPVPRTSLKNPHYYVFITGCPDGLADAVRANLMGNKRVRLENDSTSWADNVPLRGKDWYFSRAEIPAGLEADLATNNYIQITLDEGKLYVTKKLVILQDEPLSDRDGGKVTAEDVFG